MATEYRRIDGFPDYLVSSEGEIFSKKSGEWLKLVTQQDNRGYMTVKLGTGKRNPKRHKVHRLIALAFILNPENKPQVNHKNGVKTDNRVENLEWVTVSENVQHAFDTGLKKGLKGKTNPNYSDKIHKFYHPSHGIVEATQRELIETYSLQQGNVSAIINGKRLTHKGWRLANS